MATQNSLPALLPGQRVPMSYEEYLTLIDVEIDAAGRYHSTVLPDFWFDPTWLAHEPLPKTLTVLQQIAPGALRAALLNDQ